MPSRDSIKRAKILCIGLLLSKGEGEYFIFEIWLSPFVPYFVIEVELDGMYYVVFKYIEQVMLLCDGLDRNCLLG